MKKLRYIIHILAITTLTIGFASRVQAQATRTWVSGVGDDVNPCSRTAPCKTWAGAISRTAPGGEIDALDPGGFGAVTITKSITLDGGEGQIAGVLVANTNGIVVSAGANDVVAIRNLDINGLGTGLDGIRITGAKAVYIEHCQIYKFTQHGISSALVNVQGNTAELFVNDCFIRDNAAGIAVTGSATATDAYIDHCRIQGNNGFGVSASNANSINVLHSDVSRNTGEGIKIDTNSSAAVVGCILNGNLTGALDNGAQFFLADTSIFNNNTGVSGSITSFGNNNVRGNAGGNTLPPFIAQQ